MRLGREARVVLAGVAAALASILLHAPGLSEWTPWRGYSDIVHGVFLDHLSKQSYWFDLQAYKALMDGRPLCPLPYTSYRFEYPPLVAYIWFASTCISFMFTTGLGGLERLVVASKIHYWVEASFLLAAWLVYSILVAERVRGRLAYVMVASPSVVVYLAQNWDGLAALLILAGVQAVDARLYRRGGFLLAAASLTKAYPALLAAPILVRFYRTERRAAVDFLVGFAAGLLLLASPWLVVAGERLIESMSQHATWYCENCIYMLFVHNIFSPVNRLASAAALASLLLASCTLSWFCMRMDRLEAGVMALGLALSYIFTPQMMLQLLPFYPSLYTPLAMAADVANALILPFFFNDRVLRELLGLEPMFNPWLLPSPTQIAAQARNAILITLGVHALLSACRGDASRGEAQSARPSLQQRL